MIETSTHKTSSFKEPQATGNLRVEDLGEEEQAFYASIKPELNSITSEPAKESMRRILEYSRSV